MQVLVVSDTHGRPDLLRRVLDRHKEITCLFFLGDLLNDLDAVRSDYPSHQFYCVAGNCDVFSTAPSTGEAVLDGVRLFFTHGHRYSVKYGLERLKREAASRRCTVILYGHTHCAYTAYEDGLLLVNPGSLSEPRDGYPGYAVITITDGEAIPTLMKRP